MDQRSFNLDGERRHVPHVRRLHASLLRLSVAARLALASAGAVALWAGIAWALA